MADMQQRPSDNSLVVEVSEKEKEGAVQKLAQMGEVEELQGGRGLLVLRMHGKKANARTAWRRACKLLGGEHNVQPVLLDRSGHEQYPTGELIIRFDSTPSQTRLMKFAKSHGLRLRDRNEFVPQQAAFTIAKPEYMPDLVRKLSRDEDVVSVWPDTLAYFKRV